MDFSSACRSCMKTVGAWEKNCDQKIVEMFTFCTNIQVSETQLPRQFCGQCTTSIESCCHFITTARNVDIKFKDLLSSTNIKLESTKAEPGDCKPHEIEIKLDDGNGFDVNDFDINDEEDINDDLPLNIIKIEKLDSEKKEKKVKTENDPTVKTKFKIGSNKKYQRVTAITNEGSLLIIEPLKAVVPKRMPKKPPRKRLAPKQVQPKKPASDTDLKCPFCDKTFSRKRIALKKHILEHLKHKKITKSKHAIHDCSLCDRSYARMKNLEKHMEMFHRNRGEETEADAKMNSNECNMCNKLFKSKFDLFEHFEVAHFSYPCMRCDKKFTSSLELTRHKHSDHRGKQYDCSFCGEHFVKRKVYYAHVRTHELAQNKEPRFTCDHCKKLFRFKSDLRLHMHVHDMTLKRLLCDICGSRFSFKRALLEHRRVHTGEKPYTCAACGYQCSTASNMKRHDRAHRGDRPHQCTHCGKAFVDTNALRKHIYTHTGERPYKCPHCEKGYRNSSKRKVHIIRAHGIDPKEIPRMAQDGGPSKRYYATNEPPKKPTYFLAPKEVAEEDYAILTRIGDTLN